MAIASRYLFFSARIAGSGVPTSLYERCLHMVARRKSDDHDVGDHGIHDDDDDDDDVDDDDDDDYYYYYYNIVDDDDDDDDLVLWLFPNVVLMMLMCMNNMTLMKKIML